MKNSRKDSDICSIYAAGKSESRLFGDWRGIADIKLAISGGNEYNLLSKGDSMRAIFVKYAVIAAIPGLILWFASMALAENPGLLSPGLYSYDVSYAGGRIAEIDFSESVPFLYNGVSVREIECRIESAGLFNISGNYRSIIRDDFTVLYFRSAESQTNGMRIIEYWFEYDKNRIRVKDSRIDGRDTTSNMGEIKNVDRRYFDSVSIIFRLRNGFDTLSAPVYIPYFTGVREDSVRIESISAQEPASGDEDPRHIHIIRGKLPYPPYPGFGDDFEIHMTGDLSRIPIYARMEMALGFIEMKLRED